MEKIDNIKVEQNKVEIMTKSLHFALISSLLSQYGELSSLTHQEDKYIATYKNSHSTYRFKMSYELYKVLNQSSPSIMDKPVDNASMVPIQPLLSVSNITDISNFSIEVSTNKESSTSLITLAINLGKIENIKRITTNDRNTLR